MTKYSSDNPRQTQTPQHKTHYLQSSRRPSEHSHKSKKISSRTPSQSTSHRTRSSLTDTHFGQQEPAYKSAQQAKILTVMYLQQLVQEYEYDVFTYCMMLQLLKELEFDGLPEISLKVAITIFQIGSKFFDSKGPRLTELLEFAEKRISRSDLIDCEWQITSGLDFWLPMHPDLQLAEVEALCYNIEQEIFRFSQ